MANANTPTLQEKDAMLKENTVHGTPLLPFAKYHTEISQLLPFYPIHWHEEMEIIKVQDGAGLMYVDGVRYQAQKGDIFILRPFAMHSINRLNDEEMSIDAIVFNLRLLESGDGDVAIKYFAPLLNERQSVPCIVRASDAWYEPFNNGMTAILQSNANSQGAELDVKTNLQRMLYHIYNNRQINAQNDVAEDKRCYTVRLALEYIRAEYANDITIEKVAKHCGYSQFYVMKLFKQYTGSSCVDYANRYRLTLAGKQLLETNDDVYAIANKVGFNNVSYFNRQFKSQYGVTPKQFRASKLKQSSNDTCLQTADK